MAESMSDFRYVIASDLIKGKYEFDHSLKFIAVSAVGRFMFCCGYRHLVNSKLIASIEENPEGMADAMNYAKEFGPQLNQGETMDFCKSIITLDYTIQEIQNGTAPDKYVKD